MRAALVLLPLLSLAACGEADTEKSKPGADVTVDAKSADGDQVSIKADGQTGKVSVKLPGFSGNISLPKIPTDAAHFDIDGVKLYPGSSISAVNIKGDETGKDNQSQVHIAFTSPAAPTKVAAYFRDAFAAKHVEITGPDANLAGKSEGGNPFTIALAPAANGQTSGIFTDMSRN
jgi:hypothetical protein